MSHSEKVKAGGELPGRNNLQEKAEGRNFEFVLIIKNFGTFLLYISAKKWDLLGEKRKCILHLDAVAIKSCFNDRN